MKTKILSILVLIFSFSVMVFAQRPEAPDEQQKKILIVYFSHSYGNTRALAEQIHEKTGGDIFEIELVKPYPKNEREVIDIVGEEMKTNYLPEIKNRVENMDSYDIIFVGTPIWYGTASSPVISFLRSYDLSGKTIIPFYTCGRGNEGRSVEEMKKACPGAVFIKGIGTSAPERDAGTAVKKVSDYLDTLKF